MAEDQSGLINNQIYVVFKEFQLMRKRIYFIYLFLAVPFILQNLCSPTRDWTWGLSNETQSPNHWTAREFLKDKFLKRDKLLD